MAAARGKARFERVQEIIPKMIHSLGMNNKYKVQLIFFYWKKIVGETIAAQAFPANVSYGVLTLTAKNSVWANNLMMMKIDLISKINRFIGDTIIKDIRFRGYSWQDKEENAIGEPENEKQDLGRILRKIPLVVTDIQKAEEQCAAVKDQELKQQLIRLYQKNIKLKKMEENKGWQPCKKCGVLCPPSIVYCAVCEREERQKTEAEIREMLAAMPWARYADIHKYIECSAAMVNQQRVKMLMKTASKVDPEKPDSLAAKTLVMLYRCVPPDQLTDEIMSKTLHRLRNDLRQQIFKKNTKKYAKKQKK